MRYDDALALRAAAARPSLEQIREDQKQVDLPARRILERFEVELFSPDLLPSKLIFEAKAAGTRSLEQFQIVTACAPAVYLEEARLETALRLLQAVDLPIEQIASLVGYSSAVSFRRSMVRWCGVRPSQYRANAVALRQRGAAMPDPARMRRRWIVRLLAGRLEPGEVVAMLEELGSACRKRVAMGLREETLEELESEVAKVWWQRLRDQPFEEQVGQMRGGYPLSTPAWFCLLQRLSREEGRDDRRRGVYLARLLSRASKACARRCRRRITSCCWPRHG
ncbi:MAG: helix-turn-helix transcriptional regulator [Thermoanaerobaculia bacterium]|nr:helix-turn-helix transcriptional regulator [Thermoanaerobaculia bacterium]